MRYDASEIANYDLSSLRVLGSVGEPINPEAWKWYYQNVGKEKCSVVDTYWQTETGAHIAANLPGESLRLYILLNFVILFGRLGVVPMKPGSCTLPYFGIQFSLVDPATGLEVTEMEGEGVLCINKPWPSIARTVYGDHDRFLNVYLRPYKGKYFTGDGAKRDKDGFYWITGNLFNFPSHFHLIIV
jgi:acetyl-CoA synthetase